MRSQILTCLIPLAATGCVKRNADDVVDYIVVGGGTSGLVVAKRLSEDPNVSVLVIEAGDSVYNNENVTDVNGYGLAFGTDIDYAYESVNQTYANGKAQTLRAGKALGGTSTINGLWIHVPVYPGLILIHPKAWLILAPSPHKLTLGNWSEIKAGIGTVFSHTTSRASTSKPPARSVRRPDI